jgi:hypothetical protein
MKTKFAFLLIFLFIACSPRIDSSLTSGVRGQSLIGPMCPVMQVGNPCPDEPYQASFVVLRPNGQKVTRFQTDAEGRFEVKLPPGDYILHPESPNGVLPYAEDMSFTVQADQFTEVTVSFDSGIR